MWGWFAASDAPAEQMGAELAGTSNNYWKIKAPYIYILLEVPANHGEPPTIRCNPTSWPNRPPNHLAGRAGVLRCCPTTCVGPKPATGEGMEKPNDLFTAGCHETSRYNRCPRRINRAPHLDSGHRALTCARAH
jgi:hypothetical protein